MSNKKIILVLFGSLVLLIIFGVGLAILIAFLGDHLETISFYFVCGVPVIIALLYLYISHRKNIYAKQALVDIGKIIFKDNREEFVLFYSQYLDNNKTFISRNKKLLSEYDNFDIDDLKGIEVFYIFADQKNIVQIIDWKGEENEKEIESFIETTLLKQKHIWADTLKTREMVKVDNKDGESIIDIFIAIDKDLQAIGRKLLFLNLGWDSYVYTVVESSNYGEITKKAPRHFNGVDKI